MSAKKSFIDTESEQSHEQCHESVMDRFDGHNEFQPLESRQKIKPADALAKIWMSPSSELANILFSQRPIPLKPVVSTNVINELRKAGADISESSLSSESDHSSGESISDENNDDEEFESDSEVNTRKRSLSLDLEEFGISELERAEQVDFKSSSVDSLVTTGKENKNTSGVQDEVFNYYDKKFKKMYCIKLAQGAKEITEYSINKLENELCQLIIDIREKDDKRLQKELKIFNDYVEQFTNEINAENGKKILKKYKKKRREAVTRIIDSVEEEFSHICVAVNKQLSDEFYFKVQKIKNQKSVDYSKKLKEESEKLVEKFQGEKNKLMEDHQNKVKCLFDKYEKLNEIRLEEYDREQSQLEKELFEKHMLEQAKMEKSNTVDAKQKEVSDTSAWLCILNHLLKDMKQFMRERSSSEEDIMKLITNAKKSLKKNGKQSEGQFLDDKVSILEQIQNVSSIFERSIDTVPCYEGRDEKLHRYLIRETEQILRDLIKKVYEKVNDNKFANNLNVDTKSSSETRNEGEISKISKL